MWTFTRNSTPIPTPFATACLEATQRPNSKNISLTSQASRSAPQARRSHRKNDTNGDTLTYTNDIRISSSGRRTSSTRRSSGRRTSSTRRSSGGSSQHDSQRDSEAWVSFLGCRAPPLQQTIALGLCIGLGMAIAVAGHSPVIVILKGILIDIVLLVFDMLLMKLFGGGSSATNVSGSMTWVLLMHDADVSARQITYAALPTFIVGPLFATLFVYVLIPLAAKLGLVDAHRRRRRFTLPATRSIRFYAAVWLPLVWLFLYSVLKAYGAAAETEIWSSIGHCCKNRDKCTNSVQ